MSIRRLRDQTAWDRIALDPDILHGKPRVRGTRIPVSMVLELLASGVSPRAVKDWYPDLSLADVQACIGFANVMLLDEEIRLTPPRKASHTARR